MLKDVPNSRLKGKESFSVKLRNVIYYVMKHSTLCQTAIQWSEKRECVAVDIPVYACVINEYNYYAHVHVNGEGLVPRLGVACVYNCSIVHA